MLSTALSHPRLSVRFARQLGFGFAFWLMFLLILQSGNAARSAALGAPLSFGEEAVRILGASALASLSALLLVPLAARFPLQDSRWPLHLALYAGAGGLVATALVFVAWLAAPLILSPDNPRLAAPLAVQLAADAPLLTFAILGFVLLLHALPAAPPTPFRAAAPAAFNVRTRQGLVRVAASQIDWIESQENYVALHCGSDVHLMRETLTSIAGQLDPALFLRVHRRTIVNLTRLRSLRALPGGDAMAVLDDGTELRVSRTYAAGAREAMGR